MVLEGAALEGVLAPKDRSINIHVIVINSIVVHSLVED